MNNRVKGYICGIIAAVSYGTNPLGALSLSAAGINVNSVLFYRYALAVVILGAILAIDRQSFKVSRHELGLLGLLGVLFSLSSCALYMSFNHMDAGVASTLLFTYPVMVAVLMAIFFKERITGATVLSILLALSGVCLLYKGDGGVTLSTAGVLLVLVSSLSYAVYIIIVNRTALHMSSMKMTFYVLLFGLVTVWVISLFSGNGRIEWLTTPSEWFYATLLAVLPTVISLIFMNISIAAIGSTPAAIMGALEPLTAVVIGVTVFGEAFTTRLAVGIVIILSAVLLIIAGKSFSPRHAFSRLTHSFARHGRN